MAEFQTINGVKHIKGPDGEWYNYAAVMAYNNPGVEYDDATGEPLIAMPPHADAPADTAPRREYQFGDIGGKMGNETLAAAGDTFANAGNVTRSMLPESIQAYVPPSVSYLPDMALGGLLGIVGAGEKAIGYGAELGDMAARNVVEGLGFNYPFAPGTGARKLAGDFIGGLDAAGAAPEGRMLGAILDAAAPAMRRGVMDAATNYLVDDFGGVGLPGRAFGEGWSDVYHWSRSPDDFTEFDLNRSTGSTSRLGPHVGTQKAAEDRYNGWEEPQGFTIPLRADLSRPFNNPSSGGPWTELDLEMFISSLADEHGIDRRDVPPFMRRRLAEQGYTSIPYINDVEDPGSLSNIMLTDRPDSSNAVLRSRFADFDPRRATSRNISAAVAGLGFAPGLLTLPQEEQY